MTFNKLIPELSVTNIDATKHFYVDILGFEICYERKEDKFIFVKYENNQLMLEQLNGNWNTGHMDTFHIIRLLEIVCREITG